MCFATEERTYHAYTPLDVDSDESHASPVPYGNTLAYAAAADGQDWGPWGMHMMWGSWGIGMMFMMLLFWAVFIAALVFFIRWLITAGGRGPQAVTGHSAESALDILKKRYARGEIGKAEFQDMLQDLQERN